MPGARWSATKKCWYISETEGYQQIIKDAIGGICKLEFNIVPKTPGVDEIKDYRDGGSIKGEEENILDVKCDEKQKTFYIHLPYRFKDDFKKLEGAWWHPGAKVWSALNTGDNRAHLIEILKATSYKVSFAPTKERERKPNKRPKLINPLQPEKEFLRHMQIEKKSQNTIRQYTWYVVWFLTINRNNDIKTTPGELVMKFLHDEIVERNYGPSAQNQALSAIKYYYRNVHHVDLDAENIPRPKWKRPLPKVISEEEFIAMYRQCNNVKHQIILKLLYGCGLRRAEVCDLKVNDVDFKRELIFVKGKGDKYRVLNPGRRLLDDLKKYNKSFLPKDYLIEGQRGGKYSATSIEKIVKRTAEKAGLKQNIYPHMLRHTFATHHMEKGTELRLIQEALGHSSSKTTEIYTHVSRKNIKKMRNLLDDINI